MAPGLPFHHGSQQKTASRGGFPRDEYPPGWPEIRIIQENASELAIEDADTDVLFDREIGVLDENCLLYTSRCV